MQLQLQSLLTKGVGKKTPMWLRTLKFCAVQLKNNTINWKLDLINESFKFLVLLLLEEGFFHFLWKKLRFLPFYKAQTYQLTCRLLNISGDHLHLQQRLFRNACNKAIWREIGRGINTEALICLFFRPTEKRSLSDTLHIELNWFVKQSCEACFQRQLRFQNS